MYERRSRLSNRQQTELIKFFVAGATARAAGEMVGVNRNTAASYFMRLRRLIASHLPSYRLSGEIEADESYFGGVRKGKRGRGAAGKIAVFGLLKRNGRVYTAIIPDARTETLLQNNNTAISNYANNQIAKWVKKGGIDKEWDAYVKKVSEPTLGLDANIKIWQKWYDKYTK